ncbi:MAG: hypothetical protein Q8P95_04260, partial [bacterium]|nr:hypothetical protein [bacterium]
TNRDGSPMFGIDPGPDITKCKSGMPNFQSKIVVGEGPTARMPESAQIMDNIRMTDRLRKAFKNMAGYQYLPSLGVNPDTGKTDQKYSIPYDKMGYDPMELYKETMAAFIEQMRMIVADRNASNADAGANGGQPLRLGIIDNTGLKDFEAGTVAWDSGQNFERVKSLQQWKNGVYGPEVESKSAPASE